MLDKIKGMVNSKEAIDELSARIGEQALRLDIISKENSELRKEFSEIRTEVKEVVKLQKEMMSSLTETMKVFSETRMDFEKEVDDFKIVKSKLKKTLHEQLSEEFRRELLVAIERLKTDVSSYNELKKEITTIAARTNRFAQEIEKFTEIASKIKKEDFELTQFARKLMEADKEKIRLMRQVDMLERLVSRERRTKMH